MSHRHYCPDQDTCNDRDPCCLFTEGDCCCDWENQCRGAAQPTYFTVPGGGVVRVLRETPAVQGPRQQPRRKKPRAQRRSRAAR